MKDDIDSLHRAVNQIRGLRANLETLEKWTAEGKPQQRGHFRRQGARPEDDAGGRAN